MDIYEIPFYRGYLHVKIEDNQLYELTYKRTSSDSKIIDKPHGEHQMILGKILKYADGYNVSFDDIELVYPYGTDFMISVWRIARRIPYGEVRTYKWIAEELGYRGGYRAVGMALSRNPHLIVTPCHRVIRSDGSLGGFTSEGGVDLKRYLLSLEGLEF